MSELNAMLETFAVLAPMFAFDTKMSLSGAVSSSGKSGAVAGLLVLKPSTMRLLAELFEVLGVDADIIDESNNPSPMAASMGMLSMGADGVVDGVSLKGL